MLWRKLKPGKSLSVLGSVEVAVLNKVIRTGLAKKVESRAQLGERSMMGTGVRQERHLGSKM